MWIKQHMQSIPRRQITYEPIHPQKVWHDCSTVLSQTGTWLWCHKVEVTWEYGDRLSRDRCVALRIWSHTSAISGLHVSLALACSDLIDFIKWSQQTKIKITVPSPLTLVYDRLPPEVCSADSSCVKRVSDSGKVETTCCYLRDYYTWAQYLSSLHFLLLRIILFFLRFLLSSIHLLKVLENREHTRTSGSKRNEIPGSWRKLRNDQVQIQSSW
jgi:hypothetical protein